MPASQAGRHGFESRLPLQLFNNLRETGLLQKPTFRGNGVDGRAEPIEKNRLEGLTWIVTRWASRFADIKDAGPECAEQSLDSGRRQEWKTPAPGHAVRVSLDRSTTRTT